MKKGRFLWSAHRITEKQKAGKARNIKEKQLKNSRNTVSRQLVARLSSARDNFSVAEQTISDSICSITRIETRDIVSIFCTNQFSVRIGRQAAFHVLDGS